MGRVQGLQNRSRGQLMWRRFRTWSELSDKWRVLDWGGRKGWGGWRRRLGLPFDWRLRLLWAVHTLRLHRRIFLQQYCLLLGNFSLRSCSWYLGLVSWSWARASWFTLVLLGLTGENRCNFFDGIFGSDDGSKLRILEFFILSSLLAGRFLSHLATRYAGWR